MDGNPIKVNVVRYHPKTTLPEWATSAPTLWTFSHIQPAGTTAAFDSIGALSAHSGCLNTFREQCIAGSATAEIAARKDGLLGVWANDDIDQCITDRALGASGSTLTPGADVSAFGVITEFWSGSGYMLDSCTPAPKWMADLLASLNCGTREYIVANLTTPVSLIWSDGVDIQRIKSHTKFPLNPKDAGKWFNWHASGITPLVVWDPKHTGEITGPDQLFGGSTWNKVWDDGYKALASLDADKSGWLEGIELQSIRLWFDYNQNGVSEKDEVKDLSLVGVTAVGVIADGRIKGSKDITATKGFKRRQGKIEYTGKSVDWYAGSFDAKLGDEVLTRATKISLGLEMSDGTPIRQTSSPEPSAGNKNSGAGTDRTKNVTGLWSWNVDDEQLAEELRPGGLLGLNEDGGRVSGRTFTSEAYAPNAFGISERIVVNAITGDVTNSNDGYKYIKFGVRNSEGQTTENYARLSLDGETLEGYSVTSTGPDSKQQFGYQWTGKRSAAK